MGEPVSILDKQQDKAARELWRAFLDGGPDAMGEALGRLIEQRGRLYPAKPPPSVPAVEEADGRGEREP